MPAANCYGRAVPHSLAGMGDALAALRKRAKLTQPELSARTGVSVQLLSRYEGGKPMRLDTLGKILDALDADLYDLGKAAREAAGGKPEINGDRLLPAPEDPKVALISRYALEIGMAALAEVAERERAVLAEAVADRLHPKSHGGVE